jgi:hypothetical protein
MQAQQTITLYGTVSNSATSRTSKTGRKYTAFGVSIISNRSLQAFTTPSLSSTSKAFIISITGMRTLCCYGGRGAPYPQDSVCFASNSWIGNWEVGLVDRFIPLQRVR